jgi:hypothetical protein
MMEAARISAYLEKSIQQAHEFIASARLIQSKLDDFSVDKLDEEVTTAFKQLKRRMGFNVKKIMSATWRDEVE